MESQELKNKFSSDETDVTLTTAFNDLKSDIILYRGEINSEGANELIRITDSVQNRSVLLILHTPGGDPHAAFKIARRLQEKYSKFYLYVYGECKSAGTLIAIGSDEIIMADYAEFGPLDMQLRDKEEIMKQSSGLNINESLLSLKNEMQHVFFNTFLCLISAGMSTKMATEVASNLAIGFVSPILSQIDPIRMGEISRAVNIALAYGGRLTKDGRGNLRSEMILTTLVKEYPDHGFVIDYSEAEKIFKTIKKSTRAQSEVSDYLNEGIETRHEFSIRKVEVKYDHNNSEGNTYRNGKNSTKAGAEIMGAI